MMQVPHKLGNYSRVLNNVFFFLQYSHKSPIHNVLADILNAWYSNFVNVMVYQSHLDQ